MLKSFARRAIIVVAAAVIGQTAYLASATSLTTKVTLTVVKYGDGNVSSRPSGMSCSDTRCYGHYTIGSVVTLTATPANGSSFEGWSGGACSGTFECRVVMLGDRSVSATFEDEHTVWAGVSGQGSVSSDPDGVDCNDECDARFKHGRVVTINAVPDDGSYFDHWSGDCAEWATDTVCELLIDSDKEVGAVFEQATDSAVSQ